MQYLSRNMIPEGPEIASARGIRVYDTQGREYLDLTSQTLNLNLGHGHPAIVNAVSRLLSTQGFPYYISPRFKNPHVAELAKKLVDLSPEGLTKVNLQMCNGSDANDDAFKRARRYHNKAGLRNMIMSLYGSHLGVSAETISASGEHFGKESYLGGSGNFMFMEPCRTFWRPKGMTEEEYADTKVKEFESVVKRRGDVVGIIMELIPFDAGILVQPKEFVKGVERICRENDIAMIVDEVQTAFGWCGDMFCSDLYGVQPDIISLAKGMTAGFPALSATIFREKYDNLEPGTSEYTFGAQSIGCVAALANIEYLMNSGILDTVPKKHEQFMGHLKRMKERYPALGDVRGIGLILGMEFIKPEDGSPDFDIGMDVYREATNRGLLVNMPTTDEGKDNVISLKPPIVITTEEIDDSMDRFEDAMHAVMG